MRVFDRAKYYCQLSSWWAQYDVSILLFVPVAIILAYYYGLVLRGSADEQTCVQTFTFTENLFLYGVMVVVNVRDGARLSY